MDYRKRWLAGSLIICLLFPWSTRINAQGTLDELIVNGHVLEGNQKRWVRFVSETVIPQLLGDRADRIHIAARASWWGLKEGTFSLTNPHVFSSCSGLNPETGEHEANRGLEPLESCIQFEGRPYAWQVGLAAVQVPNFSESEISDAIQALWPGRAVTDVLAEAARLAGFNPNRGIGAKIAVSSGVPRSSWLLRHPVVGMSLVERNASFQCIDTVSPSAWCFSTGWPDTNDYARNREEALQSIADLTTIFEALTVAKPMLADSDRFTPESILDADGPLASKVQELARYRSEFFGRLREVLGNRQDVRIVGDRFVFQSEVLFPTGSAELGEMGQRQLAQLAQTLNEIASRIPKTVPWVLRVDGHTDRVPIHTPEFPSNWELSTARAISVVRFLTNQGITAEHLTATGFGEDQPLDPSMSVDALRRNRRIELRLTQALAPTAPIHDCDMLGADPNDDDRVAEGVSFRKLTEHSIGACKDAISQFPGVARFEYQYARALSVVRSWGFQHAEVRIILRKAAERNYAIAANWLGDVYNTEYITKGLPEAGLEAANWWLVAAEQGRADAQTKLGEAYEKGRLRVPQDRDKALEWYEKAAAQKYAGAFLSLAYFRERLGNYDAAARWYQELVNGEFKPQQSIGTVDMLASFGRKGLERLEAKREQEKKSAALKRQKKEEEEKAKLQQLTQVDPDLTPEKAAHQFIFRHVVACGESIFFLVDDPDTRLYIEIRKISIVVQPKNVTEADKLNGIEWKGLVSVTASAYRDGYQNRDGTAPGHRAGPWQDGEKGVPIFLKFFLPTNEGRLTKIGGDWKLKNLWGDKSNRSLKCPPG